MERQEGFSLRSELRRRKAAGEADIIICNGTIVKRPAVITPPWLLHNVDNLNSRPIVIPEYINSFTRSVLVFSAQALFEKVSEFTNYVYSFHRTPDIVGIVESWFNETIPDNCLGLNQYAIYRFDRPSRRGGLILLINSDIKVLNIRQCMFGHIQILCATILCHSVICDKINVAFLYRPCTQL